MNIRKTVGYVCLILAVVLVICLCRSCGASGDKIKWSLTEEDYNNKRGLVNVVAVSDDTTKAVRDSLSDIVEEVIPQGYTLSDYFTMYYTGNPLFDNPSFECWVLVEDESCNKEVIVISMPDVEDVHLVDEFIHSDKTRVPEFEVCIAPPAAEDAHYYMRIPDTDEFKRYGPRE